MVIEQGQAVESTPLTVGQRRGLLIECVPLVGTLVIGGFLFPNIEGASTATLIFLCFPLLLFGYEALKALIDLYKGVVLIQQDRLTHMSTVRRHLFFGEFERLGRMTLRREVYDQSEVNHAYRVVYSPTSKIVCELERVD